MLKSKEPQLVGTKNHFHRTAWALWPQQGVKMREQLFKGEMQ